MDRPMCALLGPSELLKKSGSYNPEPLENTLKERNCDTHSHVTETLTPWRERNFCFDQRRVDQQWKTCWARRRLPRRGIYLVAAPKKAECVGLWIRSRLFFRQILAARVSRGTPRLKAFCRVAPSPPHLRHSVGSENTRYRSFGLSAHSVPRCAALLQALVRRVAGGLGLYFLNSHDCSKKDRCWDSCERRLLSHFDSPFAI